jgi:lysine-specific demethylase 8
MQSAFMRPLPAISREDWQARADQIRKASLPLVIPSALSAGAIQSWNPTKFADAYPDKQVQISVSLPSHGVPYREPVAGHQQSVSIPELVRMLENGAACYLNQSRLANFKEFERDLHLVDLCRGKIIGTNLWIGGKTRSGLHYDNADNLFLQIFGYKRALLIDPRYSRNLYPFTDSPTKSQLDPEFPDLKRYPRFARCETWNCALGPGDAIYIPRGWWHFIGSENVSVSVNCWHGNILSQTDRRRRFLESGPRVVLRGAWDFCWHGMIGRPQRQRLFSPKSPGLQAYERLKRWWLSPGSEF